MPQEPLSETVRVLDEVVTDFIIETCHTAAQCATYARRQKIKVDDFRFALRRDPVKLGRVHELLRVERELKEARRAFDQNDDRLGAAAAGKKQLADLTDSVGKKELGVKRGRGRKAGVSKRTASALGSRKSSVSSYKKKKMDNE